MPKSTIKKVRAWAVVASGDALCISYAAIQFDNSKTYSVHPDRVDALKNRGRIQRVIPCIITYKIPNKKSHGKK